MLIPGHLSACIISARSLSLPKRSAELLAATAARKAAARVAEKKNSAAADPAVVSAARLPRRRSSRAAAAAAGSRALHRSASAAAVLAPAKSEPKTDPPVPMPVGGKVGKWWQRLTRQGPSGNPRYVPQGVPIPPRVPLELRPRLAELQLDGDARADADADAGEAAAARAQERAARALEARVQHEAKLILFPRVVEEKRKRRAQRALAEGALLAPLTRLQRDLDLVSLCAADAEAKSLQVDIYFTVQVEISPGKKRVGRRVQERRSSVDKK